MTIQLTTPLPETSPLSWRQLTNCFETHLTNDLFVPEGWGCREGREYGERWGSGEGERGWREKGAYTRVRYNGETQSPLSGGGRGRDGSGGGSGGGGGGGGGGFGSPGGGLKILYLNAQSILSKVNDLNATACDLKPDLILITESWCNDSIENNVLYLNDYEIISDLRKDRFDTTNGIGGGLLVYSRKGLEILPCDNNNNFNQYCSFKVLTHNAYVNIVLIYRPPSCIKENCDKLVDLIKNALDSTIFIGDFNYPKIDWNNLICDNDNKSLDFLNICLDNNFSQYVDFATHKRNNILDLVLCNDNSVISIDNLGPLANSDHVMLMINTNHFMKKITNDYIKLEWNKADYDKMENDLNNIDWNLEIRDDVEQGWLLFKDSILKVIEKYVPKKVCKGDSKKPVWMNSHISRLRNKKSRLYKNMKSNPSENNISKYNDVNKEFKKAVRKAKRSIEVKISKESGNTGRKKFTSYIKSKMSNKTSIGPLIDDNKNIVSDNKGMANLLNDYFTSVFNVDDPTQPLPDIEQLNYNEQLNDINITVRDVERQIDKLKKGKAPGPDGITTSILKKLKSSVVKPLQLIFQLSIQTGVVPSDWKSAKVVPIFKSGARGKPSNQRPVSLTSTVSKLQEGIIREKVMDHLNNNNLLKASQHGFMENRSCQTNLIEFVDKISEMLDEGKPVDVVYLDFSKAFDKISHAKLLKKLEAHGICGKVKNWIKNWLIGRSQFVSVNGSSSDVKNVTSSVPQGSVLGPILFIVYNNDMDDIATLIDLLRKFADDTKCAKSVQNSADAQILQLCLDQLVEWGNKWSMEFNVKKCKVMHFGRNNEKHKYKMMGAELAAVDSERDIGVRINSTLKPSQHCQESANKARAVLGQITRCFHFRDRTIFLRLYQQYVRPHLEFSSSVWSPWSINDINVLENVQKKAVGMISGLTSQDYDDKLLELNLWSLEKRRLMFDMVQVYKIANKIGNVQCSLKFFRDLPEQRVTRNRAEPLNLVKNRPRLDIRKYSFCERVVDSWNNIPTDIKQATTVIRFKSQLVKWMNQR